MLSIDSVSAASAAFPLITDWFFLGLTFLILLASWGFIVLCGRIMEEGK
jgi:hypothetical protein